MKILSLLLVASTLGCATQSSSSRVENGKPADRALLDSTSAEERQDWSEAMKPTAEHARLAQLVGEWNLTMRYRESEDAPWSESKGHVTYRSILGGRFIQEEAASSFDDTPFEWIGLYGFDTDKQKYVVTWADNMGNSFDTAEAPTSGADQPIVFHGTMAEDGETREFGWRITLVDANSLHIEMLGDEGEPAGFEFIGRRVKP